MGKIISELAGWIMQRGLQITQSPFVVYYTSPMEVKPDKMEYEIGIPFTGDTDGDERVKIKIMPKHKVLSTIYKGPYEEIAPVYGEMMQHIMGGKYEMIGTPREAYLNSPGEVPENELLTEVIFPIIGLEDCMNPINELSEENHETTPNNKDISYTISPIGYIKRNGMDTSLEVNDEYIPGLKELNNFSHVMVLWLADKIKNTKYRNMLQTYPPYSQEFFATRSEYRPHPIAVTTCEINDIDEKTGIISISGLDAFDKTLIIDLKPYIPSFDRVRKLPKWLSFLWPEWTTKQ